MTSTFESIVAQAIKAFVERHPTSAPGKSLACELEGCQVQVTELPHGGWPMEARRWRVRFVDAEAAQGTMHWILLTSGRLQEITLS